MPSRLFVASLGNPSPAYANTLHSAGHTLLYSLREFLSYPQFTRDRSLGNGLSSSGSDPLDHVLWQSPSLMNVSGKSVATAWKGFLRNLYDNERSTAKLVVVHDDLESPLGKVKIKKGGSAKGHNGIKSCVSALGGMEFIRIGVGIGRPESRDPRDVSNYVLRKMTSTEQEKFRQGAGEVMTMLADLRDE